MNIFVLDQNPFVAARYHCDRHVCKMILEYAQMMSTAHRLLDGRLVTAVDDEGRVKPKKFWLFEGETPVVSRVEDDEGVRYMWTVPDAKMYLVAHVNHPCSVWVRETDANYCWTEMLLHGCLMEYEARYGKDHSTSRLMRVLSQTPHKIKRSQQTPFAQAMPEEYKHEDAVEAYRRFYVGEKASFAKWKNTDTPTWFKHRMGKQDGTDLARTTQVD
jgi:hypothetical protein